MSQFLKIDLLSCVYLPLALFLWGTLENTDVKVVSTAQPVMKADKTKQMVCVCWKFIRLSKYSNPLFIQQTLLSSGPGIWGGPAACLPLGAQAL